MFKSLISKTLQMPILGHGAALVAAFGGFQLVKSRLDASYAASNPPVDYATGQTAFSGEQVKEYYSHMIDAGSLDIYKTTQLIDFGFIATLFAFGLLFGTFLARLGRPDSWARRAGIGAAIFAMTGAIFDVIENLISFVMLANPLEFANWIALPYSGFAALKFACITLAMVCVLITILLIVVGRLSKKPRLG